MNMEQLTKKLLYKAQASYCERTKENIINVCSRIKVYTEGGNAEKLFDTIAEAELWLGEAL